MLETLFAISIVVFSISTFARESLTTLKFISAQQQLKHQIDIWKEARTITSRIVKEEPFLTKAFSVPLSNANYKASANCTSIVEIPLKTIKCNLSFEPHPLANRNWPNELSELTVILN